MNFKIGQSVKVKKGILCPDNSVYDISGWQGRITKEHEYEGDITFLIAWDSLTIDSMPGRYIEESEEEGLDWKFMYLETSDLEPAKPRDDEDDVLASQEEREEKFKYAALGDRGKRIKAVVDSAGGDFFEELLNWGYHLEEHLTFPFNANVEEVEITESYEREGRVEVLGLETIDDFHGIIVTCRARGKQTSCPLVNLKVVSKASKNARHVKDYRMWFCSI